MCTLMRRIRGCLSHALPLIDGTDVFNTRVVGNFYMDPNLFGVSDIPVLNTDTPLDSPGC